MSYDFSSIDASFEGWHAQVNANNVTDKESVSQRRWSLLKFSDKHPKPHHRLGRHCPRLSQRHYRAQTAD
jgi:hypothetical protein